MFLFFFFKQKTAYEMRISDWSSDVCSSDLLFEKDSYFADAEAFWAAQNAAIGERCDAYVEAGWSDAVIVPPSEYFHAYEYVRMPKTKEIGRASCRERVCQ